MRGLLLITGLLFLVIAGVAEAAKDPFKLQGRLGLGANGGRHEDEKKTYEMRLGIITKRRERIRANVELRADEDSRDVRINDGFLDYKNEEKTVRVRAGRGKKILGWEYQYPTSARVTIDRTGGYGFLEERGLVGRDYFVEYLRIGAVAEPAEADADAGAKDASESPVRQDSLDSGWSSPWAMIPTDERWRLGASVHWDESGNAQLILQGLQNLSDVSRVGTWAYARRAITVGNPLWLFGGMLSYLWVNDQDRIAAEGFVGNDPFRTLIERDNLNDRRVTSAFVRAEYARLFGNWAPYVSLTYLLYDLGSSWDNRAIEPFGGIRYFVENGLDVALEIRRTDRRVGNDPTSVAFSSTSFALMGRYYF